MNPAIKYYQRPDIDIDAWDNCIGLADSPLIYARSVYLDSMASNWDGLVLGNYQAVMPLCWRKKLGVSYLYQPAFTAQLGVFGKSITMQTVMNFLAAIPSRFKLWQFPLNHTNIADAEAYDYVIRKNYILALNKDYGALSSAFNSNARRNITKARKSSLVVQTEISHHEIIDMARQQQANVSEDDLGRFRMLCDRLHSANITRCYAVVTGAGTVLSAAIFFEDRNRAYYILPFNEPESRSIGSSHLLIDQFVRDHAASSNILDFEGSDIEGVEFFYKGFGAVEENYPMLMQNNLPFPLKLFK